MRTSSTRIAVTVIDAMDSASVVLARVPQAEAVPTAKNAPRIAWRSLFAVAQAEARRSGKPLLVDFNAVWCAPCKELDRRTFSNAAVIAQSQHFVAVKVDVDKEPKIAARYKIRALPTVAVLKPNGAMLSQFLGFRNAQQTVNFLKNARKKAR